MRIKGRVLFFLHISLIHLTVVLDKKLAKMFNRYKKKFVHLLVNVNYGRISGVS